MNDKNIVKVNNMEVYRFMETNIYKHKSTYPYSICK